MDSATFQAYRHSGKFTLHGPVLPIVGAVVAGIPLGFIYSYLVRWNPFIYVSFLATIVFGLLLGYITTTLLKIGKVRNAFVAGIVALVSGMIALYFAWTAYIRALSSEMPLICSPEQLWAVIEILYKEGSWSLHGSEVSGIPLAIVWILEALVIVGAATCTAYVGIADTPFCEKNQCWLDEVKTVSTLASIVDPAQIEALKSGDIWPLTAAKARAPGSNSFARIKFRHSQKCDQFFTTQVENVIITYDQKGKASENVTPLTRNIMLPRSAMDELVTKFESFAQAQAG